MAGRVNGNSIWHKTTAATAKAASKPRIKAKAGAELIGAEAAMRTKPAARPAGNPMAQTAPAMTMGEMNKAKPANRSNSTGRLKKLATSLKSSRISAKVMLMKITGASIGRMKSANSGSNRPVKTPNARNFMAWRARKVRQRDEIFICRLGPSHPVALA